MNQSNDSIQLRYEWADRGMQQYLHLVNTEQLFNQLLAKVYYQGGKVHCSVKRIPEYVNPETVNELIREREQYLEQKVVQYVTRRLDEANKGEI